MTLRKLDVGWQIFALLALATAALMAVTIHLLASARDEMESLRSRGAEAALHATLAVLEERHASVAAGRISLEDAQASVARLLRRYRFSGREGYVAVLGEDHTVLIQPAHPETEGTDETDRRSYDGRYIAREAVALGREGGVRFNTYPYIHPLTGAPDTKTSAIARFEPWGWTLIAGVFDAELDKATARLTSQAAFEMSVFMAVFVVAAAAIGHGVTRPVRDISRVMEDVAIGARDTVIPHADLRNEVGRMARALTVFRDNALRLEAAKAEADAALASERDAAQRQRRFVSAVAHDVRRPLSILDACTRGGGAGRETAVNARARAALRRLVRLMEHTLTAATAEFGTLPMAVGEVDLADMARDAVAEARLIHAEADITCDLRRLEGDVRGDPSLLRMVLDTFIGNAVKYSPDQVDLHVVGWTEDGVCRLAVRDRGVGIPVRELSRIGERHFRASTAVGTAGAGTAVSTCMLVAALHDGGVEVESVVGEGSIFTLWLPTAAQAEQPAAIAA